MFKQGDSSIHRVDRKMIHSTNSTTKCEIDFVLIQEKASRKII